MQEFKSKARKWSRRREKRFRCHVEVEDITCQELLNGVWQLEWKSTAGYRGIPPDPYMNHWSDCKDVADDECAQLANQPDLQLYDRSTAIAIVECVRDGLDTPIEDLMEVVRQELCKLVAGRPDISEEEARIALKFAVLLWAHVPLQCNNLSRGSVRELIQKALPQDSVPSDVTAILGEDFCVKNLWRKGGIRVVWTNDICEHLISHQNTVKVFRNASMLRSLSKAARSDPQRSPFTEEFLMETLQTLYLLFRPMDPRSARDNARYMEKHLDADLELAMGGWASLKLRNYPVWHERLEKLQKAYDKKTPYGLTQWWFDRRDRVQWATFWVAFVVFVLTIVFGIISSVTGILQVYAAYHVVSG